MYAEMDQGKTRTVADFLKSVGVHDYSMTGAIARAGFAYDHGGQSIKTMLPGRPNPTRHELIEWVESNPDLVEACKTIRRLGHDGLHPQGRVHGSLIFLSIRDMRAELNPVEFWDEFATGDTSFHSGSWHLRDRMLRQVADKGTKTPANVKLADAVLCWNLWAEGRTVKRVAWWKPGTAKAFPTMKHLDGAS